MLKDENGLNDTVCIIMKNGTLSLTLEYLIIFFYDLTQVKTST